MTPRKSVAKKTQSMVVTGFPGSCEQGGAEPVVMSPAPLLFPRDLSGLSGMCFFPGMIFLSASLVSYMYMLKYSISPGGSGAPGAHVPQRGVPCTGNGCPLMDSPSTAQLYHSFMQLTVSNVQLRLPPGTGLEQGTRKCSTTVHDRRTAYRVTSRVCSLLP